MLSAIQDQNTQDIFELLSFDIVKAKCSVLLCSGSRCLPSEVIYTDFKTCRFCVLIVLLETRVLYNAALDVIPVVAANDHKINSAVLDLCEVNIALIH